MNEGHHLGLTHVYAMKTQNNINGDWGKWMRARKLSRIGFTLGIVGIALAVSAIISLAFTLPFTIRHNRDD